MPYLYSDELLAEINLMHMLVEDGPTLAEDSPMGERALPEDENLGDEAMVYLDREYGDEQPIQ
jgi:hypothetical protein